jgi:predicted nucleic acid-binding protein
VARVLIDTGAVVVLVNQADQYHAQAADWLRRFRRKRFRIVLGS